MMPKSMSGVAIASGRVRPDLLAIHHDAEFGARQTKSGRPATFQHPCLGVFFPNCPDEQFLERFSTQLLMFIRAPSTNLGTC